MLTQRRILAEVCYQDLFVAINVKHVYFHVSILPQHRPFLQFAFERKAYQYKVLPFSLSRPPCLYQSHRGGLSTSQAAGDLQSLDDWLMVAHS